MLKFNNDAENQDFENSMQLNEFVAKYGSSALNTVKNSEKYELAYAYFSSLPAEQAKEEIKNNEKNLKEQLGTYFNQLVTKFS